MGERGPAYMTKRGMIGTVALMTIGIVALMTAACGDAKLALVSRPADPLRFPAWGFTFRIENPRRLASAALRPEAGFAAARLSRPASKRGA
jgi:hypothetical protein